MTTELLASVSAIFLSLLFSYIPGFKNWYEPLDGIRKRLIMLSFLLVISIAIFLISCAGLSDELGINIICNQEGAILLIKTFITALVANQSAYLITPTK